MFICRFFLEIFHSNQTASQGNNIEQVTYTHIPEMFLKCKKYGHKNFPQLDKTYNINPHFLRKVYHAWYLIFEIKMLKYLCLEVQWISW